MLLKRITLDAYYEKGSLDDLAMTTPVPEAQIILYDDVVVAAERIGMQSSVSRVRPGVYLPASPNGCKDERRRRRAAVHAITNAATANGTPPGPLSDSAVARPVILHGASARRVGGRTS